MSGFAPDHAGAEIRVSPNFGVRRDDRRPSLVILHYTGMASGEAAEAWLCNTESQVSCHYIVHEDGRIVQMVREADRAWHAGKGSWRGDADINSSSIGIEIQNPGHGPSYADFPDKQIEAVIDLCRSIATRHAIRPQCFLAHSDVAPRRKVDPGEKFPWARLHVAGVGHHVAPHDIGDDAGLLVGAEGPEVEKLQSMLALYGYGIEITGVFDEWTGAVVEAFQRHFRPRRVDGIADRSTSRTLDDLLRSLSDAGV